MKHMNKQNRNWHNELQKKNLCESESASNESSYDSKNGDNKITKRRSFQLKQSLELFLVV